MPTACLAMSHKPNGSSPPWREAGRLCGQYCCGTLIGDDTSRSYWDEQGSVQPLYLLTLYGGPCQGACVHKQMRRADGSCRRELLLHILFRTSTVHTTAILLVCLYCTWEIYDCGESWSARAEHEAFPTLPFLGMAVCVCRVPITQLASWYVGSSGGKRIQVCTRPKLELPCPATWAAGDGFKQLYLSSGAAAPGA